MQAVQPWPLLPPSAAPHASCAQSRVLGVQKGSLSGSSLGCLQRGAAGQPGAHAPLPAVPEMPAAGTTQHARGRHPLCMVLRKPTFTCARFTLQPMSARSCTGSTWPSPSAVSPRPCLVRSAGAKTRLPLAWLRRLGRPAATRLLPPPLTPTLLAPPPKPAAAAQASRATPTASGVTTTSRAPPSCACCPC